MVDINYHKITSRGHLDLNLYTNRNAIDLTTFLPVGPASGPSCPTTLLLKS